VRTQQTCLQHTWVYTASHMARLCEDKLFLRMVALIAAVWIGAAATGEPVPAKRASASAVDVHMGSEHSLAGKAENKVATWAAGMGQWGPAAIAFVVLLAGIGIPVSEEILVIPSGFLVGKGVFSLWWTAGLIWAAVVLADLIWMLLVRRYSHVLLRMRFFRRMFHPRRILELKHLLDRYGAWVIIMGRILPGARTPTITAAGLAHMKVRTFMLGECVGAAKSVGWQLALGWLIATSLTASSKANHIETALFIALGVALVIAAVWWHRRRRKRRSRAPMQWLRNASRREGLA
jgi:membrane protein DedA with SNARE-associated domain